MTALIAGLSLGTAIGGAVIEAAGWPEAVLRRGGGRRRRRRP